MDLLLLLLRLLMATALYLFLGAVLFLLWQSLRPRRPETASIPRRYGRLIVVETGDQEQEIDETCSVGTTFPLQPITTLGRAAINTVVIPDAYASAEHAMLAYRGDQWWLEDRGSRNGTTLNSVAIDGPTVVSAGDVIGVGRIQLKLELAEPQNSISHPH